MFLCFESVTDIYRKKQNNKKSINRHVVSDELTIAVVVNLETKQHSFKSTRNK